MAPFLPGFFINQTFARKRLAVDFLSQRRSESREWTIADKRAINPSVIPLIRCWRLECRFVCPLPGNDSNDKIAP